MTFVILGGGGGQKFSKCHKLCLKSILSYSEGILEMEPYHPEHHFLQHSLNIEQILMNFNCYLVQWAVKGLVIIIYCSSTYFYSLVD